jgi:hypothetical protein
MYFPVTIFHGKKGTIQNLSITDNLNFPKLVSPQMIFLEHKKNFKWSMNDAKIKHPSI